MYSLQILREPEDETTSLSEIGIATLKDTLERYDKTRQQLILRMQTSHLHLLLFSFRCAENSSFLINNPEQLTAL